MNTLTATHGLMRSCWGTILALLLALGCTPLWAQMSTKNFDHVRTGFALTGIHSSQRCEQCHINGVFKGTPRDCASCHSMGSRLASENIVKPQQHFPTQLSCETCHSTLSFSGARFNHMGVAPNSCGTCHNGMTTSGKPAGHLMTTASCDTCHRTSAWVPSLKPDHSLFNATTNCAGCHNGSTATGKPSNHIPFQVLSGVAIGNCATCHKSGYTTWVPGQFHNNVSVSMQCATCHLSSMYGVTSKPATATHATITGFCESCHRSTATWLSVQYTHAPANAVGTGTCDTCHNGTTALGKPATHIPIPAGTAKCDSCHLGQVTFTSPYKMNHTVVTAATCTSCHNGTYTSFGPVGAQAISSISNHIPLAQLLNGTTMDCKACHSSTTSFVTETMNHNGSLGNGSGWCIGCHKTGTNYLGSMQKMSLTHQSSGKTDCSVSGCHKPLGNTGTSFVKWK
jgi:hypothetical protein